MTLGATRRRIDPGGRWGYRRLRRAAATLILLSGCQADPDAAKVPWTTKDRSVMGRERETPRFEMPSLFEAQGGAEMRAGAIDLLLEAARSDMPVLRANALEALRSAPEAAGPALRDGLADENRGVRFVAAMTIGKLGMRDLATEVEPLLEDPSASVRAAAIFALRRCGRPVDLTPLASMIMSPDPEIRGNAAIVLGGLGDPSARPLLREAIRADLPRVRTARRRIVELQIAEAMVRLGADEQLEVIRAAVFAPEQQGEIVVLACQLLGRLGDRAYGGALLDMAIRTGEGERAPEVRLAAVQMLARIEPTRAPLEVVRCFLSNDRPEIRAQAASTLGWIHHSSVLPQLTAMSGDPSRLVQVATAGAILRATAR